MLKKYLKFLQMQHLNKNKIQKLILNIRRHIFSNSNLTQIMSFKSLSKFGTTLILNKLIKKPMNLNKIKCFAVECLFSVFTIFQILDYFFVKVNYS